MCTQQRVVRHSTGLTRLGGPQATASLPVSLRPSHCSAPCHPARCSMTILSPSRHRHSSPHERTALSALIFASSQILSLQISTDTVLQPGVSPETLHTLFLAFRPAHHMESLADGPHPAAITHQTLPTPACYDTNSTRLAPIWIALALHIGPGL